MTYSNLEEYLAQIDPSPYYRKPNPGHSWITDYVPVGYGAFIMKAVQYQRYVNIGQWTLALMGKKLDALIKEQNLDRATAYVIWDAYVTFKDELFAYREAEARA